MIISASRRTDIPAFYGEWFMNRIRAGCVMVRNPFNPKQVSRIALTPDQVDCIVFWTKDPGQFLENLPELERRGFHYYFLYTLTPYSRDIEANLPDKKVLTSTFIDLSRNIGRERVVWRYDPIVITGELDLGYHDKQFRDLAGKLSPYTDTCIISFLDFYAKTKRNMQGLGAVDVCEKVMREVAGRFMDTCRQYGIRLQTCAEEIDFADIGIAAGKCIDEERVKAITGRKISVRKASGQRKACNCAESVDIGAYNSCPHNCRYCYANYSSEQVNENRALHDPGSPFLLGRACEGDTAMEK